MTWVTAAAVDPLPPTLYPSPDHLSWSQVANLVPDVVGAEFGCPRKWAYGKRLGVRDTHGPMMDCGSAMDEGLTAYYWKRIAGEDQAASTIFGVERLFLSSVETGLGDEYRRIAVEGMGLVIERYPDAPAAVQSEHTITIQGCRPLVGYSDKVTLEGVIVDHKLSGQSRVADEVWIAEKRRQVGIYWLARVAAARRGGDGIDARVVPFGRLEVVVGTVRSKSLKLEVIDLEPYTDEDMQLTLRSIVLANRLVDGGRYAPRPGRACGMCGFVDRCRTDSAGAEAPFSAVVGVPEEEG